MAMVRSLRYVRTRDVLTHAALLGGAFCMIYPLLWMLGSSFKPDSEIFANLNPIPRSLDLTNYVTGWTLGTGTSFSTFYINSFLVCLGAIVRESLVLFAGRLCLRAHPLPPAPDVVRDHAGDIDAAVPCHGGPRNTSSSTSSAGPTASSP